MSTGNEDVKMGGLRCIAIFGNLLGIGAGYSGRTSAFE